MRILYMDGPLLVFPFVNQSRFNVHHNLNKLTPIESLLSWNMNNLSVIVSFPMTSVLNRISHLIVFLKGCESRVFHLDATTPVYRQHHI